MQVVHGRLSDGCDYLSMLVLKLIHVSIVDSSSLTNFTHDRKWDENRDTSAVVKFVCDTGPRFKYLHSKGILFHMSRTLAQAEKNAIVIWAQQKQ